MRSPLSGDSKANNRSRALDTPEPGVLSDVAVMTDTGICAGADARWMGVRAGAGHIVDTCPVSKSRNFTTWDELMKRTAALLATSAFVLGGATIALAASPYDALIAQHAAANGVPVELVHRVIVRESRYNPRAVNAGNYGMMQIRLGTARGLGYTGTAQGLLDPNTNLTYAVKYLAGAYRVAGGNHARAVSLYASGYYYAAKRQGLAVANPRGLTSEAPVFASFTSGAQPVATRRNATFVPAVMSESAAPQPMPAATTSRTFRKAQAMETTGMAYAAPKDTSRPRSARAASSNPFAAMFAPEKPRRAKR